MRGNTQGFRSISDMFRVHFFVATQIDPAQAGGLAAYLAFDVIECADTPNRFGGDR
jgi:hypothetical protein